MTKNEWMMVGAQQQFRVSELVLVLFLRAVLSKANDKNQDHDDDEEHQASGANHENEKQQATPADDSKV